MIKFFRKIRQNLLSEGKTGKYLKYAIGEIVLVVIGILIALQINNWNESRLEKNLENKILKELRDNLISDIKTIEGSLNFYDEIVKSSNLIVDFVDGKLPYNDSLNIHLGKIPPSQTTRNPNTAAYENLKNVGIHLISNDHLRKEISEFYEVKVPFDENYFKSANQYYLEKFGDIYLIEMKEYINYQYAIPMNHRSLVNNHEFRNLIMHQKSTIEVWYKMFLEFNMKRAKQMIEIIDLEIEN